MTRLGFISLFTVSLLLRQNAVRAQQDASGTSPKATTLECLEAMNGLRTAAGLAEFKAASDPAQVLPKYEKTGQRSVQINAETLWGEICPKITATDSTRVTQASNLTGTFAYYPVADDKNDCNAAVEYWKGGFSLFDNEIPPKYEGTNQPTVYSDRAVSFVALYNPKPEPVVSCVLLQCPTASTPAPGTPGVPGSSRRLSDSSTTVDSIICLTNPPALTKSAAPFK
ncbi:SAG family member [Eimeria necatrix]|uniref:SAG family member n=1 Tax=Eimeria necatrix TaxID=51315 RepID=U6MGL3_9EIME|nr:SAG family member [Eimeria necatrix]CDJ63156.1 SAG family member [Eimeria necatrix]